MINTNRLTGQFPHCGATAEKLAYHSRYTPKSGQLVTVIRCKQHEGTFCSRYGTAFYDLKTPEEKVERAINQGLEGLCPEAVARIEGVHPTTVQCWVERGRDQARSADKKVITDVSTDNVELDELHGFAGEKHTDEQESDLEEVGQHWTHILMARESRLMLEVVVGPRTQESATKLVEGAAERLTPNCWPLWSSYGLEPYMFALTVVYAVLIHFIKGKGRGRPKEPQVVPDPRLRYGQVIKQRVKGRLVSVTRWVVFGAAELIPLKQISTSLLEPHQRVTMF
jgi:hypothetical protein